MKDPFESLVSWCFQNQCMPRWLLTPLTAIVIIVLALYCIAKTLFSGSVQRLFHALMKPISNLLSSQSQMQQSFPLLCKVCKVLGGYLGLLVGLSFILFSFLYIIIGSLGKMAFLPFISLLFVAVLFSCFGYAYIVRAANTLLKQDSK